MSLKGDRAIFGESNDPSKLDLRLGNPFFLHPYWKMKMPLCYFNTDDMPYRLKVTPELEGYLRNIGKAFNKYGDDGYIVIGNGATQLLDAALYALKTLEGKDSTFFPIPHYPRFTILSGLQGLSHNTSNNGIKILTIPNNPDGQLFEQAESCDILDACYAWPHYGFNGKEVESKIKVYSFAKFTGFASTRLGWAWVESKEVAELMELHIEMITSGVSIHTQRFVEHLLAPQVYTGNYGFVDYGKDVLERRWASLRKSIKPFKGKFRILNESCGMFLYATIDPKIFEKLNILAVPASAFGDKRENTWRINIGCSEDQWQEFLKRLGGSNE